MGEEIHFFMNLQNSSGMPFLHGSEPQDVGARAHTHIHTHTCSPVSKGETIKSGQDQCNGYKTSPSLTRRAQFCMQGPSSQAENEKLVSKRPKKDVVSEWRSNSLQMYTNSPRVTKTDLCTTCKTFYIKNSSS